MRCANPDEGVTAMLQELGGAQSASGHAALEDFKLFCRDAGLSERKVGRLAFAWAKYSHLAAWRSIHAGAAITSAVCQGESGYAEIIGAFTLRLGMLLRNMPPGTAADIGDGCIAWRSGEQVAFAWLRDNDRGNIDCEFQLDEQIWRDHGETFSSWIRNPQYCEEEAVRQWIRQRVSGQSTAGFKGESGTAQPPAACHQA
ncbi:hypothetical protein SB861_50930 [Paraburkholderia sp. SIMBA_049]